MTRERCGYHVWSSSKKKYQLKFPVTLSRAEEEQVRGPFTFVMGVLLAITHSSTFAAFLMEKDLPQGPRQAEAWHVLHLPVPPASQDVERPI